MSNHPLRSALGDTRAQGYIVTVHDGPTKIDFPTVKELNRQMSYVTLILDDGAEVRIMSGTTIIRPKTDTSVEEKK